MMVGHENQMSFLRSCVDKGTLSHAYLMVGPKGTGKHQAVEELLSLVLKKPWNWRKISETGILVLERSRDSKTDRLHKEISIEEVGRVGDYLNHSSFIEGQQIVVIKDAEFLSKSAANALLKTLEEPKTKKALIILLATDENKILSTIRSRCQIIRFFSVATKKIYDDLVVKGANKELAEEISRLAANQPERANDLFANSAEYNFYKNESSRFLSTFEGSLQERWQKIEPLFKDRDDHTAARENLIVILEIWLSFWRDSLMVRVGGLEKMIKNVSYSEQIKTIFLRYSLEKIKEMIEEINRAVVLLRQNVHPRLILENLILIYY